MEQFDPRQVKHQDPSALAAGYSKSLRMMDVLSITVFFGLLGYQAIRLWTPMLQNPWLMVAAFAAGYLFADFISGFVHWLADTWGRTDMPVVGKAFLRPFREHHVDQKAITHHDFVETNGNNCLICIPAGLAAVFVPLESPWLFFGMAWLLWSMLWVLGTNQFHKWSHMDRPPRLAVVAQRLHLILPPDHHAIHHAAPYATHYCITTGWLNRPLAALRFYRVLEWFGTTVFGAIPRADDIGKRAALALQEVHEAAAAAAAATDEKAGVTLPEA
jgi:hypothetical protein